MQRRGFLTSCLAPVLVSACLGLFVAPAAQAEEWTKTYTLSGNPDLRVETSEANLRVTTWDQKIITAKITTEHYKIGDHGIRIEEHQSGDTVEINVLYPHHGMQFNWGNSMSHKVQIEIRMPREGRVNLHTGDGRIELANFKGEMLLRSGDGSIDLNEVDGKVRATTGDGRIRASGRFDELEIKTGDGSVVAQAKTGSALGTGWRLETGDGSVELEIPENLAVDLALHTGDGHIDLDLPVTTSGAVRENEVHGKLNGGGNLLTIHAGDGSIHLRKG